MRVQDQAAFILHRRAYRNTSLIVDCLTPDFGRVSLVARAARNRRRSTISPLEPFVPMLLGWQGRGELGTLTGAEAAGRIPPLKGVGLAAGLYANELALRLLPAGDANPGFFSAYSATVSLIVGDEAPLEPALRRYEREILAELGFALVLDRDNEGQPLEASRDYAYEPIDGPVRLSSSETRHGPRLRGESLIAFGNDDLYDALVLRDCKHLTRWVLERHLDGRPLRSRELLRAMAASRPQSGPAKRQG